MKKKLLTACILVVCAVALVVGSVFATVAYLTSYATISNTFTVGNVGIQLYESKVDDQGAPLPNDPNVHGDLKDAQGNTYHLIPGTTYTKDPTVYINADSDASYVFVYIQNGIESIEQGHFQHTGTETDIIVGNDMPTIHDQMTDNGWALYKEGEFGDIYVFAADIDDAEKTIVTDAEGKPVGQVIPKVNGIVSLDIFNTFTVDGHAKLPDYATAEVNITAYAVQANTFDSVDGAWAAIVQAYPRQAPAASTIG